MLERQCLECVNKVCLCTECQAVLYVDECVSKHCPYDNEELCPFFDGSEVFKELLNDAEGHTIRESFELNRA